MVKSEYKQAFDTAKNLLFGLTSYHLGILANGECHVQKFNDTETMSKLKEFIDKKFEGDKIYSLVSITLYGKINYEQIKRSSPELAKEFYYSKFNLPYILEIPANKLNLETDDHAKDIKELSTYINDYLDDEYDFCYYGYNILQVKWNEYKEFSSVVIIMNWDVKE